MYILRPDSKYTPLEAKILDLSLVLHADTAGKQLHLHHPRGDVLGNGHVFSDNGCALFAERPQARRCEYQGSADVRGYEEDIRLTDEGQVADHLRGSWTRKNSTVQA